MKILVLGATGSVGRLIVAEGLARGHHITAFVRNASKIPQQSSNLRVVVGDVLDASSLRRALEGQDAVAYAIGVLRGGCPLVVAKCCFKQLGQLRHPRRPSILEGMADILPFRSKAKPPSNCGTRNSCRKFKCPRCNYVACSTDELHAHLEHMHPLTFDRTE